jgi:hypothetical protein
MTFPHWPPTSLDEAKALFNNCLDKENTHRKYLARSWWAFVARNLHPEGARDQGTMWYPIRRRNTGKAAKTKSGLSGDLRTDYQKTAVRLFV